MNELKHSVSSAYDPVHDRLCDLSRWLYEHPELSHEEREASALVASTLADLGFSVEHPAFGQPTGFVARVGSRGPEVVICAEYDALPSIGHACGHNIIAAAAVGTGASLMPFVDDLDVRLTILGTPAEEQSGGKVEMVDAGAFSGASAAMMIHPSTWNVADPIMIAITQYEVVFRGKSAHASAHPQLGVNALDAFVQAYVNVSTLRQALYPTDKIHGIINHGGDAPNIVPDYTHSSWYVRAGSRGRLREVSSKFMASCEAAATATGCTVQIEQVGNTYEELTSNPVMADLFSSNSEKLGRPMQRGYELPPDQAGSTDMGNVSQIVPTIHPMLDIDSYPAVNHQREFADHTITPAGEQAIRDGALGMAWTIVDLAVGNHWSRL